MSDKFKEWLKEAKITGSLAAAFSAALTVPPLSQEDKKPVVEVMAKGAIRYKWDAAKMASAMRGQGVDVSRIESLLSTSSGDAIVTPSPGTFFTSPAAAPSTADFGPGGPVDDMPGPTNQAPDPTYTPDPSSRRSAAVRARRAGKAPRSASGGGGSFFSKLFAKKDDAVEPQGGKKPVSKKMMLYAGIVVVVLLLGAVGYYMYSSNSSSAYGSDFNFDQPASPGGEFDFSGESSTPNSDPYAPSAQSQPAGSVQELVPQKPDDNPLNFRGSLDARGFLGRVQSLIFVLGIGVLVSLIGDIIYREQKLDGVVSVAMAVVAIFVLLPPSVPAWVGLLIFLLELAFVMAVSLATGKDYSPLAANFLLVAVFGGLIFTRIGAIQSMFPGMLISSVPPIVQLGYYFSTMNFAAMAFPLIVYLYFLIGSILSVVESIRPSGEDKSSRWGSLAAGGFGLLIYFIFLLAVHLAPWVSFLIAFLLTVAGSAALRSQPAKQWVAPEWSVRSPFDGAMLFTAILLLIVVIFGQQWWLVGLL